MGSHGKGTRNANGQKLTTFLEREGLYATNSTVRHLMRNKTTEPADRGIQRYLIRLKKDLPLHALTQTIISASEIILYMHSETLHLINRAVFSHPHSRMTLTNHCPSHRSPPYLLYYSPCVWCVVCTHGSSINCSGIVIRISSIFVCFCSVISG